MVACASCCAKNLNVQAAVTLLVQHYSLNPQNQAWITVLEVLPVQTVRGVCCPARFTFPAYVS
jgi:hypothetical protein